MASVFRGFPHLVSALNIDPRHVLHIGAHQAEEFPFYREAGVQKLTLVEANPDLAAKLEEDFSKVADVDVSVISNACGSSPRTATFNIMGRTNLSTLAEPQKHDNVASQVQVEVVRVDAIQGDANILVVDVQGLEIDVLESADLEKFDLIIAECSTVEDSSMSVMYDELDDYMVGKGFREVNKWSRDYQWINRWGRGSKARFASHEQGSVYDVAYVRSSDG
jgi:FkbM family methyltransferase